MGDISHTELWLFEITKSKNYLQKRCFLLLYFTRFWKKKARLFVYIYYTQCYCCGTEHLGVSGLMLASLIPRRSEELPLNRLRIRQGLGRFEGNWKKSLKPESTAYFIHAPLYLVTVVWTLWLATPTHRNKHASRLRNLCKYFLRQHIIYLARIDFYFLGSSAS